MSVYHTDICRELDAELRVLEKEGNIPLRGYFGTSPVAEQCIGTMIEAELLPEDRAAKMTGIIRTAAYQGREIGYHLETLDKFCRAYDIDPALPEPRGTPSRQVFDADSFEVTGDVVTYLNLFYKDIFDAGNRQKVANAFRKETGLTFDPNCITIMRDDLGEVFAIHYSTPAAGEDRYHG